MKFNLGAGENLNWIVTEDSFDIKNLKKYESIFCQGNGYMGIRNALEEGYENSVRNTFIAGTFNKFDENEVTELPNVADVTAIQIEINGEMLNLSQGTLENYSRTLNLKTGMVDRNFIWTSKKGDKLAFKFERFVSMADKHLIAQKVTIKSLNDDISVKINSGINGQMTNEGVQHFSDGDRRAFDLKYIQANFKTTESKIDFVITSVHSLIKSGENQEIDGKMDMKRRGFYMHFEEKLQNGEALTFTKLSTIHTSRDLENENKDLKDIQNNALENLKSSENTGFDNLFEASKKALFEKVWDKNDIVINSKNDFDQLAIRFALYHIYVMSPLHDNRMNIGAKGLSGEGYKGHTFWDTEMFLLPFFMFSDPNGAKSLLEYRYKGLDGARKKAKEFGYEGAMYPWESAWISDGEVTPLYGAVDIITGELTKIWSGIIEQHITSDVAFGVWQYFEVTNDNNFMEKFGYEIIIDTANFWQSRLEFKNNRYEICGIVGPDEYKEHKDNNAFTNYMAWWNIKKAIEIIENEKNHDILHKLPINIDDIYKKCVEKVDKIYLPSVNEDGLIPQDDTYLSLEKIDLSKYKQKSKTGTIIYDYNLDQINEIQVSKQADTLLLFYLMENLFDYDTKKKNFYYYEDKCLHDSSLSLSTHSILASDIFEKELAYDLFERACRIDLSDEASSSDMGIHAASFGGVWQCIANGFVGVRNLGGNLRISPRLPEKWDDISINICYKGVNLAIKVTKNTIFIKTDTPNAKLEIQIFDSIYVLEGSLEVKYE